MPTSATLVSLCKRLETVKESAHPFQAFTGFDGFIDKIQKAVRRKQDQKNNFFSTIKDFSKHLGNLGGRSGQVELVTLKTKIGGNAPILSNTFANLGMKSICLGAMGYPDLHPTFKQMHPHVEVVSRANPGESQALEFDDGKIILSELGSFKEYTWSNIKLKSDLAKLRKMVGESQVLALVDWANLPQATDIWQGFLDDVIRPLGMRNKFFLFDLCDPSKKSTQEIDIVLDLISSYSYYGKVTLGMNENEANKIWRSLNGFDFDSMEVKLPPLKEVGSFIYNAMSIDTLLIHPTNRTLTFQKNEALEIMGRLVTEPKVLTGGGDNLNAGYCLGLLHGLDLSHCMVMGMAASGAYIQNGKSPDMRDLISYLKAWSDEMALENDVIPLSTKP